MMCAVMGGMDCSLLSSKEDHTPLDANGSAPDAANNKFDFQQEQKPAEKS